MLTVKGIFRNGVIYPSATLEADEGAEVTILLEEKEPISLPSETEWESLLELVEQCKVSTGIPDLAQNHDFYIHGAPKRDTEE